MDYIARRSLKDNSPLTNKLSESLLKKLSEYSWPGNVRELENIAERYLVLYPLLGDQAELTIAKSLVETEYHMTDGVMDNFNLSGTLKDIDKRIIHNVFNLENRNIMRTAIRLGIDRQTVKKYLMIEPDQ
jgi:transcriptional regulator with PAS, ATPase and Fis domain